MKLILADENFPFPSVQHLRQLGYDILTLNEMGKAEQAIPDEEVIHIATSEKRAVLTLNRKDFIRLHRRSSNHTGIIVCTFDPDFRALALRVHDEIGRLENLAGQLIRVSRG